MFIYNSWFSTKLSLDTITRPVSSGCSPDISSIMLRLHFLHLLVFSFQCLCLTVVSGGCLSGSVRRDPADCSVFYQCDGQGGKHTFNCPDGLLFNSEQGLCDWPDNVDCNNQLNLRSVVRISVYQNLTRKLISKIFRQLLLLLSKMWY